MVAADVAVPFTGADLLEDGWRDMFGSWFADGVCASVLNELLVYGDSSGRQVKLKTGRMRLAGMLAGIDSEKTITGFALNASGNPRIDQIVARLDRSADTVVFAILQGIPGTSPVPLPLTSDAVVTERSLARISIANNYTTIAAGAVTPERALLSSHSVPAFDTAVARDLWVPSPKTGYTAALRNTGGLYEYWGGSWKQQLRVHGSYNYAPPADEQSGTNTTWPEGAENDSIDVPAWATRARCFSVISQAKAVTSTCNVEVTLLLGALTVRAKRIRWDATVGANAEQDIVLANDIDCSAIAGTTVALRTIANNVGSETGRLRVDSESSAFGDVEFR